MEHAPFLCEIIFIVSDQPPGVKWKKISTLMQRVLIVYTQFMKSPAGGVYYRMKLQNRRWAFHPPKGV